MSNESISSIPPASFDLEAVRFDSTHTDSWSAGWSGEARSYLNSYSQPVVLGQVMSDNDNSWSVFWAAGSYVQQPPVSNALIVGKHVGQDPQTNRSTEQIGYIVVEAGTGSIDGQVFQAGVSNDNVQGTTNAPPYAIPHALAGATSGVLSAAAMDGGDGGWPVLYGAAAIGSNDLAVAIEEDQIVDEETRHTTEQVGYLIFE